MLSLHVMHHINCVSNAVHTFFYSCESEVKAELSLVQGLPIRLAFRTLKIRLRFSHIVYYTTNKLITEADWLIACYATQIPDTWSHICYS